MDYQELYSKAAITNKFDRNGKPGSNPGFSLLPAAPIEQRLALRNCGVVSPESIEDYINHAKGYSGLDAALKRSRDEILDILTASALKDETGLVADRLRTACHAVDGNRYIVCKGFDGDPGSKASRCLLSLDPHSVLEGLLICLYASGAGQGIICLDENDAAGKELAVAALKQMEQYSLLGDCVLNSDFGAVIEIREVAVSPVVAEATALLRLLEGRQALPYLHDAQVPLTLNGNLVVAIAAEMLACISGILQYGTEWYTRFGTNFCRGTTVVTINDNRASRVLEVPRDTTLHVILEAVDDKELNQEPVSMVQFGGVTGAYYGAGHFDVPVSCDEAGDGVLAVYRGKGCVIEQVRDVMNYLRSQSCGQCVFCREGTAQIAIILDELLAGKSQPGDYELLEELSSLMSISCICSFGLRAATPFLSSLREFRDDYESHLKGGKCSRG